MPWFIRRKKKIRVLFILSDLPTWKSEPLYLRMLSHPRMEPILGITSSLNTPGSENDVMNYCRGKNYPYRIIDPNRNLAKQSNPDIVLFQKPYNGSYHYKHFFEYNLLTLYAYVNYGAFVMVVDWWGNQEYIQSCWKVFFDNIQNASQYSAIMSNHGRNIALTGLPFMDIYLQPKEFFADPWRDVNSCKRIIYAPHHTIGDEHMKGIKYSTFLEYGELIFELARKYNKDCYFAFKPHPLLYKKLLSYWGQEKTDSYYQSWKDLENAQIETGEYVGLFMHSDAMIHDCCSFTVEYLYSQKPVLYLLNEANKDDNLTSLGKQARDLHYKAHSALDIEAFILSVINEEDPKRYERVYFFEQNLLPPSKNAACDNIINSILGC